MANPTGLCKCGCGEKTRPRWSSNARLGWTKGEPQDFVYRHKKPTSEADRSQSGPYVLTGPHTKLREHRMIAERVLGRSLPSSAQVHHIDGNGRNNVNNNLVICQDMSYHRLLHVRHEVLKAGGNPNTESICRGCKRPRPKADFNYRSNGWIISQCRSCLRSRYPERSAR